MTAAFSDSALYQQVDRDDNLSFMLSSVFRNQVFIKHKKKIYISLIQKQSLGKYQTISITNLFHCLCVTGACPCATFVYDTNILLLLCKFYLNDQSGFQGLILKIMGMAHNVKCLFYLYYANFNYKKRFNPVYIILPHSAGSHVLTSLDI